MDPLVQQSQPTVPQQPQQAPQMPYQAPAPVAPEHKKVGPIIAILIIILVLIIGALYLFASRINEETPADASVATSDTTTAPAQSDTSTQNVQAVTSNSDDVGSLEADLNASASGLDNQNF